ncbi:hypothetical protein M2138_000705 [Dysgonomonadaceae bacterium PH5-43]|nr:hypothetical protein [Dysgonomonadaceae bacterium PH5-43]
MKKYIFVLLLSSVSLFMYAQNKSMQVYRNGYVTDVINVSEIDSVKFGELLLSPSVTASLIDEDVFLTWTKVQKAESYDVFRSTDNINYTVLATGVESESYTDKEPIYGYNYYKVKASSAKGSSLLSEASSVDTKILDNFSLFQEALIKTCMNDSLYLTNNENYTYQGKVEDWKSYASVLIETPEFCKYGYTVLMESDETFAKNGINTIDDLITYAELIYYKLFPLPVDPLESNRIKVDYTDRRNALNRFVSYHIMDRMLEIDEFILPEWSNFVIPNYPIREYIEMMMPNSMIEVQKGNFVNVSMLKDIDNVADRAEMVKIEKRIKGTSNVLFHEINNILTYDKVETNVLNKRIRINAQSLLSEFATNKYRGIENEDKSVYPSMSIIIPREYLSSRSKVSFSENTQFQSEGHFSSSWANMYGDEMLFIGKCDFTITTPPIPAGNWEIRLGYSISARRDSTQIYINGKPSGDPIDFRINSTNQLIGWINDFATKDNGVENDKQMRENGYMKAPASLKYGEKNTIMRNSRLCLRKIIATQQIDTTQPLSIRFESLLDSTSQEFMIDYIEFIPVNLIEDEDRN